MPEFMNANCRNVCSKNVCPNELVLVFVSRNIQGGPRLTIFAITRLIIVQKF
jgi:hypothetical protein